jgi:hypothetical protein
MALNTTFVAGNILTAAQMNNLPFGVVGKAENTSLSQSVTTLTDLTSLSVTFTGVAGRLYRVEGRCLLRSTEGTNPGTLMVRNGSNTILQLHIIDCEIANIDYSAYVSSYLTATGSTTLKLSAQRQAGSGTFTASGGGTFPAQILVTDIGLA